MCGSLGNVKKYLFHVTVTFIRKYFGMAKENFNGQRVRSTNFDKIWDVTATPLLSAVPGSIDFYLAMKRFKNHSNPSAKNELDIPRPSYN